MIIIIVNLRFFFQFVNKVLILSSPDYSLNCTPLSPITVPLLIQPIRSLFSVVVFAVVLRPGQRINVGRSNMLAACWTVQHVEN